MATTTTSFLEEVLSLAGGVDVEIVIRPVVLVGPAVPVGVVPVGLAAGVGLAKASISIAMGSFSQFGR
jgi:hypothetical protein